MKNFFCKQWGLLGLFATLSRQLSEVFPLLALVDLLKIEVSELDKGLEGATEVFSNRSFRHGGKPWLEAAGDLPAVEEVCWRLPSPARALYLGRFVIEALVIVGEVSVVGSCG